MEGPGLVRRKATLEAASLRKPHTFWDGKGSGRGYPSTVVVDHTDGRERRTEAVLGKTEFTDGDEPGVARGHNGPVPPVAGGIGSPTRSMPAR